MIKFLPYILFEKQISILALEMASPEEPALCRLYRHTFVPCQHQSTDLPIDLTWRRRSRVSPPCRTDAGSRPPPLNSLTFRPVVGQLSEVVPFLLLQQRLERPAKRGYVGLVAVGVQEQAEDILVPPLLRNCLTLNYISFS